MAQQTDTRRTTPLTKLRDSELDLADDRQDIRGRTVVDQDGKTVGHVKALFIDEADRKVRMIDIGGGGFLGMDDRHFLLPVEAITSIGPKDVHVDETAERIEASPAYDPHLVAAYNADYWGPYYGYYGRDPYWNESYTYPDGWFL